MSLHMHAYLAYGDFSEGLQGGTMPWGSLWERERKRSLASQLPLMSFLVGEVLPHGKLMSHTLGSSVVAWELGTMPQNVIFPKSKSEGHLLVGEVLTKRDGWGRAWGTLRRWRMLLCGFCLTCFKFYFLLKQTLWGNLLWQCFCKLHPETELIHWCRFPFWCKA